MVNRPKFVYFFCIFLTLYHLIARVGLATDLQWHLDVGRDRMLTPPHLMILGGFPICVCFPVLPRRQHERPQVGQEHVGCEHPRIRRTRVGLDDFARDALHRAGGIYDDYWHAQFGIDTTVITPPHMLTLFGGILAEFASLLLLRT